MTGLQKLAASAASGEAMAMMLWLLLTGDIPRSAEGWKYLVVTAAFIAAVIGMMFAAAKR